MEIPVIESLMYGSNNYTINIIPSYPDDDIIPENTIMDQIIFYINNTLYHDTEQLTNIQYHRIIEFLNDLI